ncbi:unnamed protein product [Moneuplotes crassus]|uniref:Uncharacterized protein n=1 Tax=Euplotes crassus TaxID=5936 RepID=A0AAD1XEM1_EUPCR|nr:unnamed protein product [Moneuplotes crassus]
MNCSKTWFLCRNNKCKSTLLKNKKSCIILLCIIVLGLIVGDTYKVNAQSEVIQTEDSENEATPSELAEQNPSMKD